MTERNRCDRVYEHLKEFFVMAKDDKVILACEICMSRNYATHRSKKNVKERMELRKYCPKCGRVTLHKETK